MPHPAKPPWSHCHWREIMPLLIYTHSGYPTNWKTIQQTLNYNNWYKMVHMKSLKMDNVFNRTMILTHSGQVTHKCIGNVTIIGSDNGLSPVQCQAIIWTNAGILLIGPSGTNFSEILIKINTFSFKKMRLKGSSVKWRPFCLGLNVLIRLDKLHFHVSNSEQITLASH